MKVLVIGMGKSGRGAARFLLKEGHEVIGYDKNPFELTGVRALEKKENFDLIVLSSGISKSHKEAQRSCPIIGEAELAFKYMKNRCIGVTGTNGKTTLTLLITHILNFSGKKARSLGNIGRPLCEYLLKPDPKEIIVAELSSFQMEMIETNIFEYGVILNITPDHLDRYKCFDDYVKAKLRLEKLVKKDLFVTKEIKQYISSEKLEVVNCDSYLHLTKKSRYFELIGHDKISCAFAVCKKFGISWESFIEGLKTFKRPQHRLEFVDEIENVHFINDSKSTNIESSIYAVRQINRPILLIAGGVNKNRTFVDWKETLSKKVKKIFAIGNAGDQIESELSPNLQILRLQTLKQAVNKAFEEANSGDVILLSPGCASWDQFKNFEERGETFKKCVFELKQVS